jgi:hypothetical protein
VEGAGAERKRDLALPVHKRYQLTRHRLRSSIPRHGEVDGKRDDTHNDHLPVANQRT